MTDRRRRCSNSRMDNLKQVLPRAPQPEYHRFVSTKKSVSSREIVVFFVAVVVYLPDGFAKSCVLDSVPSMVGV